MRYFSSPRHTRRVMQASSRCTAQCRHIRCRAPRCGGRRAKCFVTVHRAVVLQQRCRRPSRDEHRLRSVTPHANAGIFALHRNMHEARLASPSIVALNRRLAQVQRCLHGSLQMQASSHCIGTYTRHVLRSPSVVALDRRFAKAQRSLHGSMQVQASSHCIGTRTRHALQVQASKPRTAELHKCSVWTASLCTNFASACIFAEHCKIRQ